MAGKLREKVRKYKHKLSSKSPEQAEPADSDAASVRSADSFTVTEIDTVSALSDVEGLGDDEREAVDRDDHRYVRIVLYSARQLLAKDYSGYSDPYVEGRLADERIRSRVVQQTTYPNWNQEFTMKMAKSEDTADHTLKLTVFDYDGPHRSPDFLGQLRLPLATLLNETPDIKATDKKWYSLTPRENNSGKAQGDICVGLEFIDAAQARQIQVTQGQGADATATAAFSDYSLALCVYGTRGVLSGLSSGLRNGLFVEARVGSYATKTATVKETSSEGEFEVTWDKQVLIHMDDAMRVPKTAGFFNTVAHHFYENAYENLRRNGAFNEIRLIVKREKGVAKKGRSRGVNIVGITHMPLSQIPRADPPEEEAAEDDAAPAEATPGAPASLAGRVAALSSSVKDVAGRVLSPLVHAVQPSNVTDGARAPAGADQEVTIEPVDSEQDVTKQAEQRFWLPLERTGGRQAGELCVSLLLAKEAAGEAVVEDEEEEEEGPDAPEPPPLSLPDPLEEALVDEELPAGAKKLWKLLLGTDSEVINQFYKLRAYWDINVGQWTAKGGQRTRQVEYTMPLKKNALGPSEAYNVELYTVAHKEPGGWVVNIEVNTPKVPYGTAFHSNVQWACQHSGKGKARLRITGQVEFTKGCFVKGVITKATQEGMREAYAQLMDILRAQLGTAAPVSAATVAQRVASTSEGVHGRLGGLQALLCLALVALLLLGWGVWRLDRGLQAQLRLLQQLARG